MTKIIAANWKMNHGFTECDEWIASFIEKFEEAPQVLDNVDAVVCPPIILVDNIVANLMDYCFTSVEADLSAQEKEIGDLSQDELSQEVLDFKPLSVGAQNCHFEESGAFTGEISAKMLDEIGCEYVILGHSERRANHFESDEIIAKKIKAAASEELTPILCVGESKEVRDKGEHLEFVYKQLMASIDTNARFKRLVIAYEPIWSIGTGVLPTLLQIKEMCSLIKKVCDEKLKDMAEEFFVIYGGSANLENAKEILAVKNVDGLLVGGASLDAKNFFEICKIAGEV
jgi:triosephosphate isomerase